MIDDINKKIEKINLILSDDNLLKTYIEDIESKKFDVPKDLNKNIRKKLDTRKSISKFSILKIAACTVFAVIMWYSIPQKNDSLQLNTNNIENNVVLNLNTNFLNDKLNLFGQKINDFFMISKQ